MEPLYDKRSVDRAAAKLGNLLTLLKRRGQILTFLTGAIWIVSGMILLIELMVSTLGWWGGSVFRAVGWSTFGVGTAALTLTTLVIPLRLLARRDAVAKRIGEVFPIMASDVLSASQLIDSTRRLHFSRDLAAHHLKTVEAELSSIPRGQVFSAGNLIWPGGLLLAGICCAAVLQIKMPSVVHIGVASLLSEPRAPEHEVRRVSAKSPVLGDLSMTLRYPEYLKRDERRLRNASGGLVAPLGTTVVLEGRSLVPGATQGTVHLPGGGQSSLAVSETGSIRGRFIVGSPGEFYLALGSDNLMIDGPSRRIEIEADSTPKLRLLRPVGKVELAVDGTIALEFEAQDDHGLERIDLVLRGKTDMELRKTIIRVADQVRRFKTTYRWSLESVRIKDETELELELLAYDNDTILGPKPGRSEPLAVRVLTPASRHKSVVEAQTSALDGLVDLLARRLEQPPIGGRKLESAKKRFWMLRSETEDLLGKTARLIGALNRDALTPRRILDTFAQIREDLSNQLLFEARLHGDKLADFTKRRGADKVQIRLLENAVIRVDDLIIEQQLTRIVKAGGILDRDQSELETLLDRYNKTRTEIARRALLNAIGKIEQSIAKLQQDVEAIRGRLGDNFVNPSSLSKLDILGSLEQLKGLLAKDDLSEALNLVKNLSTDLDRMMAALESGLLSFRTDRFGEGERFLGELLDRVMNIEAGQLQLRRETIAVQRRYQERLVEVMRGRIDPLVKRQLKRVKGMLGHLDGIKTVGGGSGEYRLRRLEIALNELKLALGQGDLDEARSPAGAIVDIVEEWTNEEGQDTPEAVVDVGLGARQLDDEIVEAYPRPGQLLSERDRRRSKSQASSQRMLTSRARRLRIWIDKQGDEARFLSHRALTSLRTVGGRMSESTTHLEARRVRQSVAEQTAALDELSRLREDLKRGDEVAPLESRPIVLGGRVELTSPDDYEVPKEFREDILEAMRGDLPNKYEEAIKRYYEILVK
jgi:hypothetical protein